MERKALRFVLTRLLRLAGRLHKPNNVEEVKDIVAKVTTKTLHINLPLPDECLYSPSPALFAEVYSNSHVSCSVFGLRSTADSIPLHDHPAMHGFIKVLQGALKISSFSTPSPIAPLVGEEIQARYDGTRVVTPMDGVIHLSSNNGNIHEVRALEPGSFFFDALVPGYQDVTCSYFEMPEESSLPSEGSPVWLRRILEPPGYHCTYLYYEPLRELNA